MIFRRMINHLKSISIDCYAVCLYFMCLPFTVVTTPFGSLLKLITFPVIGVLLYKTFIGKKLDLRLNAVHFTYSVYMIYSLMGLFLLREEITTVVTKDMMLAYFVMMLMSMRVYNEKERNIMESSWIVVGIICTALCLTSQEVANEFENRTIVYVLGFPEDPNQFCAYFIMPVMVCMKRIVEKRKTLPFYVVLLVLIMYSILRTGSRGGFVGIIIGVFVCIILAVKSIKGKIAITSVALVAAVFVVAVIFPLLPEDVQMRYNVQSVIDDSGAGRFDVWSYLFSYTTENPTRMIRGSGLLSTYPILENANVVDHVGAAHNQFVQVFCDQGLLGICIYLGFIAVCFFRNWRKEPYYACAFIAVMAFSMSLTLYVFKPYMNIIIMCAMNFAGDSCIKGKEVSLN